MLFSPIGNFDKACITNKKNRQYKVHVSETLISTVVERIEMACSVTQALLTLPEQKMLPYAIAAGAQES